MSSEEDQAMVIDIMYKKFGEERDAVFEYLYVSGQTNIQTDKRTNSSHIILRVPPGGEVKIKSRDPDYIYAPVWLISLICYHLATIYHNQSVYRIHTALWEFHPFRSMGPCNIYEKS